MHNVDFRWSYAGSRYKVHNLVCTFSIDTILELFRSESRYGILGMYNTKFKPTSVKPDQKSGPAYKRLKNLLRQKIYQVYPWPGGAPSQPRSGGGEGGGQNDHFF